MSSKLKGWLFVGAILLIIMLPIVIDYTSNKNVEVISLEDFFAVIDSGKEALIYFGNPESEDSGNTKDNLMKLGKDYDIDIKIVDTTELSEEEQEDIKSLFEEDEAYVFIKNQSIAHVNDGAASLDELRVLVDRHFRDILLPEHIKYKTIETFDEFIKLANSKTPAMFVIGRDTCPACSAFKPIFNDLAEEYEANIIYLNSEAMDLEEWNKIMTESGMKIPGSCRDDGESIELHEIQSIPTGIFTKKGKIVDCSNGVIQKDALTTKLKSAGIIK